MNGRANALNTRQVREIRQLHGQGIRPPALAQRYHVSVRTIHRAVKPTYVPHDQEISMTQPTPPASDAAEPAAAPPANPLRQHIIDAIHAHFEWRRTTHVCDHAEELADIAIAAQQKYIDSLLIEATRGES